MSEWEALKEDIAVQNRKFFPYPLLLKAAEIARERNYNRQVTDEFIDKTIPEAENKRPPFFTLQVEQAVITFSQSVTPPFDLGNK